MVRARASRFAWRAALAAVLVLITVVPAAAASPDVRITTTSSPTSVTVGLVVAYPITVTNMSGRTLNHVDLTGSTSLNLEFLGSAPAGACPNAICDFGTMRAKDVRSVTFYYRAPSTTTPSSFVFTATAHVSEGAGDNPGASHQDTFDFPITTIVLAINPNLVRGHAFGTDRIFDTGLTTLGTGNPHGTKVRIPVANVEVTAADLPPTDPAVQCPPVLTTCFGWGSSLSVGDGGPIPGGIEVTTRWDYSELSSVSPPMSAKKLHVAHLLGGGQFREVTGICTFVAGVPTNMPCFSTPPTDLPDKDVFAVYWLDFNRVTRGY
jgi:hypothetical protein